MIVAAICGVTAWAQLIANGSVPMSSPLASWVDAGSFHVDWALRYDTLAATMVAMVTFVATLIHIYSVGYMGHERTRPRGSSAI